MALSRVWKIERTIFFSSSHAVRRYNLKANRNLFEDNVICLNFYGRSPWCAIQEEFIQHGCLLLVAGVVYRKWRLSSVRFV